MSDRSLSTVTASQRPLPRGPGWIAFGAGLCATLAIIGLAYGPEGLARIARAAGGGGLHLPRVSLIVHAPLAVQVHLATVAGAFVLGGVLMLGRKGVRLHRLLGWAWVGVMATTAVASLFIHQARPGGFSILHLFSGWTLVALPLGVVAARRRKVPLHGRTMSGLYVGALLVAGVIAFTPGRLMWNVFFG